MDNARIAQFPLAGKVASMLLVVLAMCVVGGTVETVSAQTSPVFVGAGDIAGTWTMDEATAQLLDQIVAANPAATRVFTLGDNAYQNGTAAEFTTYYNPTWGRHRARTFPVPGNHEYQISVTPYFNYFYSGNATLNSLDPTRLGYYSYNFGAWHIIALNSRTGGAIAQAQLDWLRSDLEGNQRACTLAYWHHPRFSSGNVHGNNGNMAPFWQLLHQYGADVVLNGHEHVYERFNPQDPTGLADPTGIRQFTVGTGGTAPYAFATIQPNSVVRAPGFYGVLRLTLHPTSYDWEFVKITAQQSNPFRDSGTGACHTSGPPPAGSQVTLNITDGWDSKNQKTLVQDGKVSAVTGSDGSGVQVESNQLLSLQFAALRNTGTLRQVTLHVEHSEEMPFAQGGLVLQAGGGALTDPFVALERQPAVQASNVTTIWDVTSWVRDTTRANDFNLVVRNLDPGGKKVNINRAYLVVTYGPTPVIPSADIQVRLFTTNGYDLKNQKTLVQDGKLYAVQGSDNQWGKVEPGYFTSYEFQNLPPGATIQSVRINVEHHEEEGMAANSLLWEAGLGLLANPSVRTSTRPALLSGQANEATVEWDVSNMIPTLSDVNDLKLKVNNTSINGKKTRNDRVYVIVTYR